MLRISTLSAPLALALFLVQPCIARAGSYHLLPSIDARPALLPAYAESDPTFHTTCAADRAPTLLPCTEAPDDATTETVQAPEESRPHFVWAGLISAGVIGGSAVNSLADQPSAGYHFAHEGWFGENTYEGGADKVSHFVSFEIIARELTTTYEYLGFSHEHAVIGGFAVSSITGLVNEVCDGANQYGFSYEDLIMDVFGAGTAAVVSLTDTGDLIGFRFGPLPGPAPPHEIDGKGRDYSHEIYTADLKLGGMVQRLGASLLWPARFFLLSTSFGVQGYPYGAPSQRERLIGLELGLNFEEMLYALNVTQDTWWGIGAHAVFDNLRIPYTQIGFRYDINHGHWYGPGVGGTTM